MITKKLQENPCFMYGKVIDGVGKKAYTLIIKVFGTQSIFRRKPWNKHCLK